jgi:hypothetical protein
MTLDEKERLSVGDEVYSKPIIGAPVLVTVLSIGRTKIQVRYPDGFRSWKNYKTLTTLKEPEFPNE